MAKLNVKNQKIVIFSLLFAIMIVLEITGIGMIQLPFLPMAVTIMQVPVVVGACVLGPFSGAILGFLFGLLSFLQATFVPVITSFLFTPVYTAGEFTGNGFSLIICFLPRILIGVFSGLFFKYMIKKRAVTTLSASLSGIVGSLTNTIFVLGFSALFFGPQYLEVSGANKALILVIGSSVLTNGVPEAIVCAILTSAIVVPLYKRFKF